MTPDAIDALLDEHRHLSSWKAEAIAVLRGWEDVFARIPAEHRRLGESMSASVARYIDHLEASATASP